MKNYSIVVCGTVTNKSGFRFKVLNDTQLPGTPARYLEIDAEKLNDGSTYLIRQQKIDGDNYAMMVEYRRITPREQETSRGAYIAVGVVVSDSISVNDSIVYYQIISEIHAHLKAYRNGKEQFVSSFDLEKYMYRPKGTTMDSAYLVDTLCKASFRDKPFEKGGLISYDDVRYAEKMISSKNFKYISDNSESLRIINDLESELEKERNSLSECNRLYQDTNTQLEEQTERYKDVDVKIQKQENDISFKEQQIFSLEKRAKEREYELGDWENRYYEKNDEFNELKREMRRENFMPDKSLKVDVKDDAQEDLENNKTNILLYLVKKYFWHIIIFMLVLFGIIVLMNLDEITGESTLKASTLAIVPPKVVEEKEGVVKETPKKDSMQERMAIHNQYNSLESSGVTNDDDKVEATSRANKPYPKYDISKSFYGKDNAFNNSADNKKTSLWYVYGRVSELAEENQEFKDIEKKMKTAFMGISGRYAKGWATKLSLFNGKKILLTDKRKKGLLAIWECSINSKKNGHVGFVEEIKGNEYRLSDFDRKGTTKKDKVYRDEWYTFPTDELSQNEQEGYLNGCLPTFYKLTP